MTRKYVVEYEIPYTRAVRVGVEADSPEDASLRVRAAFDSGELYDGARHEFRILYDDFEENGDAGTDPGFKVIRELDTDDPWPPVDPGPEIETDQQRSCAWNAVHTLVAAYRNGEERGGGMEWSEVDSAYEWALRAIGRHPKEVVARLATLAGDERWTVRRAAAERSDLPPVLVERLAGDEEWVVRRSVAKRLDLPETLVERLAGDQHWAVRQAVAERPNLPQSLVERLARDENTNVRRSVVRRPDLPAAGKPRDPSPGAGM